jgi:hypothetical protein
MAIARFGDLYQRRYGRKMSSRVVVEDRSANTLENFANVINANPGLMGLESVGLLSADFHVRRVTALAQIFGVNLGRGCQFSSSVLLGERAELSGRKKYAVAEDYLINPLYNADLRDRLHVELCCESGLYGENNISYWLGYLGDIENPAIIQQVFHELAHARGYEPTERLLGEVGIAFSRYAGAGLDRFTEDHKVLTDALKRLKVKPYREVPPIPKGSTGNVT